MKRIPWNAIAIGIALIVLTASTVGRVPLNNLYENASLRLRPTAEKAYQFGSRHLDVKGDAAMYDINRAEKLLLNAISIDPYYPYANHQLARVAFLRGQFDLALNRINVEIAHHGKSHHNAYYIRGLIEGYAGDYTSAIADYEKFLEYNPKNWAAINDLAWVLLKDKQYAKVVKVTTEGISLFPDNPWLLNSRAIALFETKKYAESARDFEKARILVQNVTAEKWSVAYPGNDPRVAQQGVDTLTKSIVDNLAKAREKIADK